MRTKLLFAFLFLSVGLALAGYSEFCFSRSGLTPVSIPILNASTHITTKFLSCANARYRIGLAFDEPGELRFAKPDCIGDPHDATNECAGIPSPFKAAWALSRGSRVVQQGFAPETIWRVDGQPFLLFGASKVEMLQWYQLDVDVISQDARMAQARPRLKVEIWTEKSFLYDPEFQGIKLAARISYGLCLFIAGILTVSSLVARRELNSVVKEDVPDVEAE